MKYLYDRCGIHRGFLFDDLISVMILQLDSQNQPAQSTGIQPGGKGFWRFTITVFDSIQAIPTRETYLAYPIDLLTVSGFG